MFCVISICGTGRRATFWDISNCGELVMPYIEVTLNVVLIFVRTIKCLAYSALFHYKYWKRDETSTFAKREGHSLRYRNLWLMVRSSFALLQNMSLPANDIFWVTNSISFCGTGRRATFWDISNCGELVMPYIEVTLNVVLIFVRTIKCLAHSALFHYKY